MFVDNARGHRKLPATHPGTDADANFTNLMQSGWTRAEGMVSNEETGGTTVVVQWDSMVAE